MGYHGLIRRASDVNIVVCVRVCGVRGECAHVQRGEGVYRARPRAQDAIVRHRHHRQRFYKRARAYHQQHLHGHRSSELTADANGTHKGSQEAMGRLPALQLLHLLQHWQSSLTWKRSSRYSDAHFFDKKPLASFVRMPP